MIKILFIFMLIPLFVFAKDSFKIGVLYWSMNIPGQVAMRKGLEAEAKKIQESAKKEKLPSIELIEYVAGDGDIGIQNQISQFEALLKSKVDAIVVQPTDSSALVPQLKKANSLRIPVVAYDQYITEGELASYVTSDNYQAGYLNGEYVAAKFPRNKQIKIVIVEYPLVSSTVERVNGFIDALNEYKVDYVILKTYFAVEPISGAKAGEDILRDFPQKGSIDVVFTINDGGGLSVAKKLMEAKRDEIFMATIDGDPLSVELIRKGSIIKIDSAQFCGALGAVALRNAYDLLLGKKVTKHILVPTFPITKESIDVYTGWLGEIPREYKKAWSSNKPIWYGVLREFK